MTDWNDLTKEQKTFIRRYLKKGFLRVYKTRGVKARNARTIDDYGRYEKLKAEYAQEADRLSAIGYQHEEAAKLNRRSEDEKRAGNFQRAVVTIQSAIDQLREPQRVMAELAGKGATQAHQKGVLNLLATNKAAGEKVIARLKHADVPTVDLIRKEKETVADLEREIEKLEAERADAETKRDFKVQEWTKKNEEFETAGVRTVASIKQYKETEERLEEEYKKLEAERADAETKRDLKKQELAKKRKSLEAGEARRALMDALTFGPLSPGAARSIPGALVEKVVELFGERPALAIKACELTATAKDPRSMVETALFLAEQCRKGFVWTGPVIPGGQSQENKLTDARSAKYAADLLERAAYFGPEFAKEAQAAIAAGVTHKENPKIDKTREAAYSKKKLARIRATEAAGAMMKTGADGAVTLDLNGPAFEEVLQRHKFSRHGQLMGSPMMNAELEKLKDFFGDPAQGAKRCQEAGRILNSITTVPRSQAARALLKKSMNIRDADFRRPGQGERDRRQDTPGGHEGDVYACDPGGGRILLRDRALAQDARRQSDQGHGDVCRDREDRDLHRGQQRQDPGRTERAA